MMLGFHTRHILIVSIDALALHSLARPRSRSRRTRVHSIVGVGVGVALEGVGVAVGVALALLLVMFDRRVALAAPLSLLFGFLFLRFARPFLVAAFRL